MKEALPSQWLSRFLRMVCPDHLYEEIEGDLIQRFRRDCKKFGEAKARRRLTWNTLRFFRPGIVLRNKFSTQLNQPLMITSYLKVMARGIAKRKFYSAINILCLTVGLTFAFLIGTFIRGELQVNKSLQDVDQLFLVEGHVKSAEGNLEWFVPGMVAKAAVDQYATIFQSYYRFWDRMVTISKGDKHLRLQTMIGDSTFLQTFGFRVLHGEASTALNAVNTIIITEKTARQYFNTSNVVGETLTLSTERAGLKEYLITAVIADPEKKNSVTDFMNMNAQAFLSLANRNDFFPPTEVDSWNLDIISYLKLQPGVSRASAEEALQILVKKNAPAVISEKRSFSIAPLTHYYRLTNHGAVQKLILSLTVVVIFILVLAITNFINISIASSFTRLKEVGVRKVIGGLKRQVIFQFVLESMVLSLLSGLLAIGLYQVLHKPFSNILNSTLPSIETFDLTTGWITLATVVGIGILAGIYPAVYQSATRPIESLKGKIKSVKSTLQFSRALVAIQFGITGFIFIGAIVLSTQTSYFLEKDLGFTRDHVLVVTSVPRLWDEEGFAKMDAAKAEFLRSSKIKSVSLSWGAPGWNFSPTDDRLYRVDQTHDDGFRSSVTSVDEDYLDVFGIELAEGNFLLDNPTANPGNVVINQTAQKLLAVNVGDKVKLTSFGDSTLTVTGILHDFNFETLHEPIRPVVFLHNRAVQSYRYFSFKLEPGSLVESVSEVESLWKRVFPNDPFDYTFTDEKLKTQYATELQLKQASTLGTVLMLIIVLTGALGLVSLSVSKRSKEVGIRKVLGASVSNILLLLSREYMVLMTVAFVLVTPLAYWFMQRWLENFAYHIDLQWWMFVLPSVILFGITLLIVSLQSLKTALTNPVKSLKYE